MGEPAQYDQHSRYVFMTSRLQSSAAAGIQATWMPIRRAREKYDLLQMGVKHFTPQPVSDRLE